jgi:putative flippase GtrA
LILVLNYGLMSFLIKALHWYPTIARAFSAVVIGFASFVIHRSYSFRVSKKGGESVGRFP